VPRRLAAFAAIVLLVAACSGGGETTKNPVDAEFARFDGTTAHLSDYRGKPLVVNFFSSTCQPCIAEMPALEQVHREVGSQVVFLGMNVQDTVEGGQAFVETVGITWELGRDPTAAVLQGVLKGTVLPATFMLDAQGRIVYSHLGKLDDPKEVKKLLQDHHLIT
jgi:thiol-disulfide isomerase/thioredoxin